MSRRAEYYVSNKICIPRSQCVSFTQIAQSFACGFLFGLNDSGDCNGVLPSDDTIANPVLSIAKNRDGEIFMKSGCNREFQGELQVYDTAISVIKKLLKAAGKSVIEFINIPIWVIKFLLGVVETLFTHMKNVCGYFNGYVGAAKAGATYENSRFALLELACRFPSNITLQKGYGCDGLDNTCDSDKQIDECAEDIFPPDIDANLAFLECGGGTIFTDVQAAEDCVNTYTLAVDDCKQVVVTTEADAIDACASTVTLTAIAQGCGNRTTEDTSSVSIPVQTDGEAPKVSCDITEQRLISSGEYTNLGFSYDVSDDCSSELAVTIEVFSNELGILDRPGGKQSRDGINDLVFFVSTDDPMVPVIIAHDMTCEFSKDGDCDDKHCTICHSGGDEIKTEKKLGGVHKRSREYQIKVTATDKAGRVGTTTCNTFIAGGDKEKEERARKVSANSPRFLISTTNVVVPSTPVEELT